ncbi:MAG: hypothetical protein AB2L16_09025 [Anaerolineaceae bacterium]
MPQDFDSLLASFLPACSAAAVFITANSRISSSVQPNLRGFSARIIRDIEMRQPTNPGSAGEYHLLDLDGRQMFLVSSLLNQSQPVSLLFPIETRFDAVLNAFSALEKLLNAPDLPDLNNLKPRKNSPSGIQRWQDALFEAIPESIETPGFAAAAKSEPKQESGPSSEGWTLIF